MANSTVSLILHASALVFIYSLYSLLQEKIMKTPYGPAQERFTSASLLVLSNRLFSLCAGVGFSLFLPRASGEAVSVRGKLRPTWPVRPSHLHVRWLGLALMRRVAGILIRDGCSGQLRLYLLSV